MTAEIVVYVCGSEMEAETAKQFLLAGDYTSADILHNGQVENFVYDAQYFGGGGYKEALGDKWIVIGRLEDA